MTEYLKLKKSNCVNCYKCIRHCPVKSIKYSTGQAQIVSDECILCGQCFVVCPQNAKEIRNDVPSAMELIKSGPVIASLAPSFVANYPGATAATMEKALKQLGFTGVEETAIGASIVKTEYERIIAEGKQEVIISTCCHSVNTLVEKYYPEVLPYLATVVSPMQAHCQKIKQEHPGAKTVFIGPCISKKAEADAYPGYADCVLTFEELSDWLKQEGITVEQGEDHLEESRARLFPTTGGILRTMKCDSPDYAYLVVDGIENVLAALDDIKQGRLKKCFIEMSICAGSCIGGPAMERERRRPVTDTIAVNRYAGRKDFVVDQPDGKDLIKDHRFIGLHRQMPGEKEIEEILHKTGKFTKEQELNCGACGYSTCREKAIAVYQGKADLNMCLPFLTQKAQSFSDTIINNTPNGIIVLNEDLEVQQINSAACHIINIRHASDVLGDQVIRILDPKVFLDVMSSGRSIRDEKIYLAEYKRYVEQSVIYDRSYHIVMCIMRDVTEEERERKKKEEISQSTIEVTDRVIEKQMRVVQEIASLLGETTAETKIALTNLKDSLNDE
ncbi:MAG TPA: 4Fe-4S binding protein [Candidatus Acutalibacter stercorigallinarum]|nr:4Fe-4S binding protein [Candidatus Acutalibacter stercorigallinarum]